MELLWALSNLTPYDAIDILLVTLVFFSISFLFRGTQAVALLRGTLIVVGFLIVVSSIFRLDALGWLLSNALFIMAIAIPVIFQPEMRQILERLGRSGFFSTPQDRTEEIHLRVIDNICTAAQRLSERRHGALIVLERESSLRDFTRTGVAVESIVSAELMLTVFWPKTELHDGAVIIDRHGRLITAAAVLPLSSSRNLPQKKLGTRHRAALGITEVSDAVCVVVSEETGRISVTNNGRMIMNLDVRRLRTVLNALYGEAESDDGHLIQRIQRQITRFARELRS